MQLALAKAGQQITQKYGECYEEHDRCTYCVRVVSCLKRKLVPVVAEHFVYICLLGSLASVTDGS